MSEKDPSEKTNDPVAGAYDLTTKLYFGRLKDTLTAQYLTFAPFPEPVDGFSWLLVFTEPGRHPDETKLMLKKQVEMRNLLFSAVDFTTIGHVMDIGCGHGSDLIQLGGQFPHLKCDGYTVSPQQYDLCTKRILQSGLQKRVRAFLRDSAQEAFPQTYDLMFGIEVAHHIENKASLFSNMACHVKHSGVISLADVLSNTGFDLLQPGKGSFSISKEHYARLLADNGLKVISCTNASPEIANFLYDPNFQQNLEEVNQRNPDTQSLNEMHSGFDNVGIALSRELICYLLLTIRKAQDPIDIVTLTERNLDELNNPISYQKALDLAGFGT